MNNKAVSATHKNVVSGFNVYKMKLLQGVAYSRLHTYLAETLLPFRLSIPEWKLIGQLHEYGNMKLSDLTDRLSYAQPLVTRLSKQMEEKGFVERLSDPHDERAKVIKITPSGNKLIKTVEAKVIQAMGDVLNGISQADLKTYIQVLSVIVKNTNDKSGKRKYVLTYD